MGASFRNTGQILELAGCDLLTISPELLQKLSDSSAAAPVKLNRQSALDSDLKKIHLQQSNFRLALNNNAMASEKLAEGIRLFCADTVKLEQLITAKR